ncbi:ABC transporter permease [Pikeienuella piscinae]|uniref:ABC transporter permease n=1 Tax=Pikeienuella piscinae TaxID=2748098 RepID=A0A7L5C0W7_9RHOB|nr:ABC transporter permease [Pikeienuella piscinae]QIE56748.1 ABC transporter permease [Pikeienuella piscinae]
MSGASALVGASRGRTLRREIGSWSASLKVGGSMLMLIVLAAIFAPVLAPYDPTEQDFMAILMPPSLAHPFGTDNIGRDIFSRVLYGARIDLTIGFLTTYVPMTYGVVLGAYSGYVGGRFDSIVSGLIDVALAFPFLVLIIIILAILGPGIQNIYIAVFLVAWTMYARLARAEMMVESTKDYMTAARVLGYPRSRIVLRHGLPNVINSSIVFSATDFVLNIVLVSSLSFIGLGVQPPAPEWGAMISEGRDFIRQAWWLATLPGLAIVITGVALALIGDGLARRLGERHHTTT